MERQNCEICSEKFEDEDKFSTTIIYSEWLEINDTCKRCNKRGCIKCLSLCHSCCNEGDLNDDVAVCRKCEKKDEFTNICNYHDWIVCPKHINEGCGECYANKNYDKKMS